MMSSVLSLLASTGVAVVSPPQHASLNGVDHLSVIATASANAAITSAAGTVGSAVAVMSWRPDGRCGPRYKIRRGNEMRPAECPSSSLEFLLHDSEPNAAVWRRDAHCCHLSLGWCGSSLRHCSCGSDCVDYRTVGNSRWATPPSALGAFGRLTSSMVSYDPPLGKAPHTTLGHSGAAHETHLPVEEAVRGGRFPVPWRSDGRCGPKFKVKWYDELVPAECPSNSSEFDSHDPSPTQQAWRRSAPCCHLSLGWCGQSHSHCTCGSNCVNYGLVGNVHWGVSGVTALANFHGKAQDGEPVVPAWRGGAEPVPWRVDGRCGRRFSVQYGDEQVPGECPASVADFNRLEPSLAEAPWRREAHCCQLVTGRCGSGANFCHCGDNCVNYANVGNIQFTKSAAAVSSPPRLPVPLPPNLEWLQKHHSMFHMPHPPWEHVTAHMQSPASEELAEKPQDVTSRLGEAPVPWRSDGRCGPRHKLRLGDELLPAECPANAEIFDRLDPSPTKGMWRRSASCCHLTQGWCGGSYAHCSCGRDCVDYEKVGNIELSKRVGSVAVGAVGAEPPQSRTNVTPRVHLAEVALPHAPAGAAQAAAALAASAGGSQAGNEDVDLGPHEKECGEYMHVTGCGWTSLLSCEGENKGAAGVASRDTSEGYRCCCELGLWAARSPQVQSLEAEVRRLQSEQHVGRLVKVMGTAMWKLLEIPRRWLACAVFVMAFAMWSLRTSTRARGKCNLKPEEQPLVDWKKPNVNVN
eukprot:TRINITY_DN13538_c0_g1_i1.p1 TRINITY_DN13538_c0_g1~~TRINITY_DN13538_c0_g1_i1.p1  ORF type:complete len:791 (-),score=111.55 TRINITY_DN13538_c0_g1_i1:202-2445(-)